MGNRGNELLSAVQNQQLRDRCGDMGDETVYAAVDFQNKNFCRFGKDTVILGDFNSNAKWDSSYSAGAYETFVSALNDKGIVSAYHYTRNERHGEEKTPTFYLYRQKNRTYHIDYCFCDKDKILSLEIGAYEKWRLHSDHMPLFAEIKFP